MRGQSLYDYCMEHEDKKYLLDEWDYEKNEQELGLSPKDISRGNASIMVNWLCNKGHSYTMRLQDRQKKVNCPYCSNRRVLGGYNDLTSNYSELLKEWDYERNEKELGLSPEDVYFGSHKVVNWVCQMCGNKWKAMVLSRTIRHQGCRICASKRWGKVHSENSATIDTNLASNRPDLLIEWDYEKNVVSPYNVSIYSGLQVNWVCDICGKKYLARVADRTYHSSGCPQCAKESHSSFPEQVIYYYLGQVYKEVINGNRNLLDNNLELDIYIPEIKTAIEYDGVAWHKDINKDLKKNKLCQGMGIRLIRIREKGLSNIEGSINIFRKDNSSESDLEEVLKELFLHLCIDIVVNIERDRQIIYSQYIKSKKENSLAIKFPEIAKEWHPAKNGNLTPENVSCASKKKVWWLCNKGHEWEVSVNSRTKGRGCPYCSGNKVLKGFNDLCTTHPELVKEWNYEKNGDLTPDKISKGSGKKVWWKCQKGHEWDAAVSSRSTGVGCPYCSGQKVLKGFNDLCTTHPELLKEWNCEKNGDLTPYMVSRGSHKQVYWKCSVCGYEWASTVRYRTSGRGCPECAKKNRKS